MNVFFRHYRSDPVLNQKLAHLVAAELPKAKCKGERGQRLGKSASRGDLKLAAGRGEGGSDSDSTIQEGEFDVSTDEDDNVLVNKVSGW